MSRFGLGQLNPPIDARDAIEGDGLVLRDGILVNERVAVPSGTTFSGARVYNDADQDNWTSGDPIAFNQQRFDTDGYHDTSTNNERLTAPFDGYYLVGGQIRWSTDGNGDYRALRIRRDNTDAVAYEGKPFSTDLSVMVSTMSTLLFLTAGQYVELEGVHDSSSADADILSAAGEQAPEFWIVRVDTETALLAGYSPILDHKPTVDTPDDEFDSTTLDGKWTAVTGSVGTVDRHEVGTVEKYDLTTRPGWLLMQAGRGGSQDVRLRQDYTLPDGESIILAAGHASGYDGEPGTGISQDIVALGLNDSDTTEVTGNWIRCYAATTSGGGIRIVFDDDGGSSFATTASNSSAHLAGMIYLRIARSGTNYRGSFSVNGGVTWEPLGTQIAMGVALDNVWINGRNAQVHTSAVPIQAVDWIRLGTDALDPWSHSGLVQLESVPEWMTALNHRVAGETAHVDDDFFGQDSSGDYTEQTVSGTATWSIGRGVQSCVFLNQSSLDVAASLKSITSASAPMTIETAIRFPAVAEDNPGAGLLFTDGTATSSNLVFAHMGNAATFGSGGIKLRTGTLTSYATTSDNLHDDIVATGLVYLRVIWISANTWQASWSMDGNAWINRGIANRSKTMTPTHIGLAVTAETETLDNMVTYEYLRVYDSDLSV